MNMFWHILHHVALVALLFFNHLTAFCTVSIQSTTQVESLSKQSHPRCLIQECLRFILYMSLDFPHLKTSVSLLEPCISSVSNTPVSEQGNWLSLMAVHRQTNGLALRVVVIIFITFQVISVQRLCCKSRVRSHFWTTLHACRSVHTEWHYKQRLKGKIYVA